MASISLINISVGVVAIKEHLAKWSIYISFSGIDLVQFLHLYANFSLKFAGGKELQIFKLINDRSFELVIVSHDVRKDLFFFSMQKFKLKKKRILETDAKPNSSFNSMVSSHIRNRFCFWPRRTFLGLLIRHCSEDSSKSWISPFQVSISHFCSLFGPFWMLITVKLGYVTNSWL